MSNLYQTFLKSVISTQQLGGYKAELRFAPVEDFDMINYPATPTYIGDSKLVTTADTFITGKGYNVLPAKMHSVTSKTTSAGDDGAQSLNHEFEAVVLGDSATHMDTFEKMLNDNCVFLIKDQDCINGQFVRFGDDCLTPVIKVTFDGKTTKEGKKEYKIVGTIKGHKVFYTATVTTISDTSILPDGETYSISEDGDRMITEDGDFLIN